MGLGMWQVLERTCGTSYGDLFCKLRMCTCSAILVLLQMCISGRATGAGRATRTLRRGRPIGALAAPPLGVFLQLVNVHMLGKDGFAPNV